MFLPEIVAFDLPAIPPLDKEYITYLSVLICGLIFHQSTISTARPGRGLESIVFLLLMSNIGTAIMNPLPLYDEGRWEDGLGPYWVIAQTADDLLTFSLPFFLGRAFFRTYEDLKVLFDVILISGLVYTGLIFIEFVLSIPFVVWQFSYVIYNLPVRPNVRWGLTQPVLFMENGLSLASHMALVVVAASSYVKAGLKPSFLSARWNRLISLLGLVLSLNVAGNVYGWTFSLAFAALKRQLLSLGVFLLTVFILTYPLLRLSDAFPYQPLVEFAAQYDEERAFSLEGRFLEEEHVIKYLDERLFFGWGGITRTPGADTFGQGEVGLDGWWTIRLGEGGLVGVMLHYLVLALPVLLAWKRMKYIRSIAMQILVTALMAMIALRMTDLLINGWWNSLPVFLAGVLYGVVGTQKVVSPPPQRQLIL